MAYSTETELRGKNLVASRTSKFKKLLALTKWPAGPVSLKSYWPSPKLSGPQLCIEMLWWVLYVCQNKNNCCAIKKAYNLCIFSQVKQI